MCKILPDISRTFSEFLLLPNLTTKECIPENVSLKTPLVAFMKEEEPAISLNVPVVSAIMQSVSNDTMAIALAREGGISFIYGSQSIEDQARMVLNVKKNKAGFVVSDSNIGPTATLKDVVYPMYLPSGTKYSGEEVITKDNSERVILTYTGVKPFILIEEASNNKEHETTLVSGEVVQYGNVLGVLTSTSLNWSNNGKEYYLIGESLSSDEILQIASSTATVALTK